MGEVDPNPEIDVYLEPVNITVFKNYADFIKVTLRSWEIQDVTSKSNS